MPAPKLRWLEASVLAGTFAVLVLVASGGPGWSASSVRGVLAVRLEHSASAPLYDLVAGVFALVPAGEPGFRLGLLGAVLGALALAGVVAAARALVPKEPLAGGVGALVLLLAPPFRDALATPQIMAACGAAWAVAFAARWSRARSEGANVAGSARDAAAALVACAVVVGSAPWLGAALALAVGGHLARDRATRPLVAIAFGAIGLAIVAWWWSAIGELPGARASLAYAIASSGRGAGAIVVGAGLLGVAFGAVTGLRGARPLAVVIAIAAAHEVIVGASAAALLTVLAIGVAIVAAAVVRVFASGAAATSSTDVPASTTRTDAPGSAAPAAGATRTLAHLRPHALVLAAGVPLVLAALATGIRGDDPGATPTRIAEDLIAAQPPGPGVFVATRPTSWFALDYEREVAGLRSDLLLVPPMPSRQADAIVASALRLGQVASADAAAFGRLDVRRAIPRGRGFQLVGEVPAQPTPVEPPAAYPTPTGRDEGIELAIERARLEAGSDRLDAAAEALGLVGTRFNAADRAVLAASLPSRERPLLFELLPLRDAPTGPWLVDTFGDDLAYVAGVAVPPVPADAPMPRRLLARWREILAGKAKPDDPAIAAMGSHAVAATAAMLHDLRP